MISLSLLPNCGKIRLLNMWNLMFELTSDWTIKNQNHIRKFILNCYNEHMLMARQKIIVHFWKTPRLNFWELFQINSVRFREERETYKFSAKSIKPVWNWWAIEKSNNNLMTVEKTIKKLFIEGLTKSL